MRYAVLAAGLMLGAPAAAIAANANNPYANVDHRVDAGNNTGDTQVDVLNQAQLNGGGPVAPNGYDRSPPATPRGPVAAAYPPPPGYAPPPVAYYAPPAYVVVPRPYVYYYPRPFFYGYW